MMAIGTILYVMMIVSGLLIFMLWVSKIVNCFFMLKYFVHACSLKLGAVKISQESDFGSGES